MKKTNFVKTSSESVAQELRSNGFKELPKEGDKFVFINKTTDEDRMSLTFDESKVVYTDLLAI